MFLVPETVSWLCIVAAFPFALMGFVKYHGLTAEQFLMAYIRSELMMPKELKSKPVNYYAEANESFRNKGGAEE